MVAFIGRSNVGKSSLLNALIGKRGGIAAGTSPIPGYTKTIDIYRWIQHTSSNGDAIAAKKTHHSSHHVAKMLSPNANHIPGKEHFFVDMPGYGYATGSPIVKKELEPLVKAFLASPLVPLTRLFLLIDSRHGIEMGLFQNKCLSLTIYVIHFIPFFIIDILMLTI